MIRFMCNHSDTSDNELVRIPFLAVKSSLRTSLQYFVDYIYINLRFIIHVNREPSANFGFTVADKLEVAECNRIETGEGPIPIPVVVVLKTQTWSDDIFVLDSFCIVVRVWQLNRPTTNVGGFNKRFDS